MGRGALDPQVLATVGNKVTVRLRGREACQAHVDSGAQLYVFANEVDDAGPVDMAKAVEIRAEDASLVYCDVTVTQDAAREMGWIPEVQS